MIYYINLKTKELGKFQVLFYNKTIQIKLYKHF